MTELILAAIGGFIIFSIFFLVFILKREKDNAPARFHSCGNQGQGCTCGKAQTGLPRSCASDRGGPVTGASKDHAAMQCSSHKVASQSADDGALSIDERTVNELKPKLSDF